MWKVAGIMCFIRCIILGGAGEWFILGNGRIDNEFLIIDLCNITERLWWSGTYVGMTIILAIPVRLFLRGRGEIGSIGWVAVQDAAVLGGWVTSRGRAHSEF